MQYVRCTSRACSLVRVQSVDARVQGCVHLNAVCMHSGQDAILCKNTKKVQPVRDAVHTPRPSLSILRDGVCLSVYRLAQKNSQFPSR